MLLTSLVLACPPHSTPAPENATFDTSCVWLADRSKSLYACVDACAADGGVPACPNSEDEFNWIHEFSRSDGKAQIA